MTWRSHSCSPTWRLSAFHAARASAAIALCFFAFHVPLAIIAPYALLYRTHTGLPAVYQCRLTHWILALVNATNAASEVACDRLHVRCVHVDLAAFLCHRAAARVFVPSAAFGDVETIPRRRQGLPELTLVGRRSGEDRDGVGR